MSENNQIYDESQIQVLEGLEPVRKRPGMYIGSTGSKGLHHLVYEIVDNSIDEALTGNCSDIYVSINQDNSITVQDNGRGIPCGLHPIKKIPTLELILTVLHAGGKFGGEGYETSGGLHGVGSSVVNALSKHMKAIIYRDGNIYTQEYECGKPLNKVEVIGKTDKHGTQITFKPDYTIFDTTIFNYNILMNRFKESAFLNKNITITLEDKRVNKEQINQFHFEGGLKEFVEYINNDKEVLHDIVYIDKRNEKENVEVEIAFQYINDYIKSINSYANNINTIEGGTHLRGYKDGFLKAINSIANELKLIKTDFTTDDIEEGLSLVISVKLTEPQFEGQTKTKLGNSEIRGIVSDIVNEQLHIYLKENIEVSKIIIEKLSQTQRFRENLKQNKNLEKKKKSLRNTNPVGKLADCSSKNPDECEIHIVEGESAGGSAKQGRNRKFQAILPSKGKIINCEKQKIDRVLSSEEIRVFISALGTGIDDEFDIDKIRYKKICLMQDADSDGGHIRSLWITFIYRYMREIIERGYLYIDQPPLYKNEIGKKDYYTYTEKEQEDFKKDNNKINNIQRYKGLGEMSPEQLWETTLNPENRTLLQITIDDAIQCDKTITLLMGDKVEPRKEFIKEFLKEEN